MEAQAPAQSRRPVSPAGPAPLNANASVTASCQPARVPKFSNPLITKTPTRARATPAFVDGAVARLHAAALAAGAESLRAGEANYFAHLHGVEAPPQCQMKPCRLGGLCCALQKLTQHQNESQFARPFLDAADEAANLRRVADEILRGRSNGVESMNSKPPGMLGPSRAETLPFRS